MNDGVFVKKDKEGRPMWRIQSAGGQRTALPLKPIDIQKVAEIIKAHEMLSDFMQEKDRVQSSLNFGHNVLDSRNSNLQTQSQQNYGSQGQSYGQQRSSQQRYSADRIVDESRNANSEKQGTGVKVISNEASRVSMKEDAQGSSVNYWKEIRFRLDTVLGEIKDMALIVHHAAEFDDLIDIMNKLPENSKILYVSLTKTYNAVQISAKKIRNKFYFIDCVSAGIFGMKTTPEYATEQMPPKLLDLIGIIDKWSQKTEAKYVFIDSLSQFIDFSQVSKNDNKMYEFFDELKRLTSQTYIHPIFLYDNSVAKNLSNLPRLQVETIIMIEIIRENVNWSQ